MAAASIVADEKQVIMQGLSCLLETGQYSDLEIVCGLRKWQVHKVVVCARSEYFEKACNGRFSEASSKTITLYEDDPKVVDAMLRFLYTGDYDEFAHKDQEELKPLAYNILVNAIGDKYRLPVLCKLAESKFNAQIGNNAQIPELCQALDHLWSEERTCQAALRKVTLDTIVRRGDKLLKEGVHSQLRQTVEAHGSLGWDLCVHMRDATKAQLTKYRYKCFGCTNVLAFNAEVTKETRCVCEKCDTPNYGDKMKIRRIV